MARSHRRRILRALPLALGMGASACESRVTGPNAAEGALIVVVTTDLAVPKDIDGVEVTLVTTSQGTLQRALPFASPTLSLPEVVPWRGGGPGGERVRVVATGYRQGTPQILGEASLVFPEGETLSVRLHLSFLCWGPKSVGGRAKNGSVQNACGEGRTCRGGRCEQAEVEGELGFDPSEGLRQGTREGSPACFDGVACFSGQEALPPRRTADRCTLTLPPGSSTAAGVALKPRGIAVGVCDPEGRCYVPLEEGEENGGVRHEGDVLSLPMGACDDAVEGVLISSRCPSKAASLPLCAGPAPGPKPVSTEAGKDGGAEENAGPSPGQDGGAGGDGGRASDGAAVTDGGAPLDGEPKPVQDASSEPPRPSLAVHGAIHDLSSDGLVLVLNGSQEITVAANAEDFAFPTPLPDHAPFEVRAKVVPRGLECAVLGGRGRVGTGEEWKVRVDCGAPQGVVQITSGESHSCALLRDGTVRCRPGSSRRSRAGYPPRRKFAAVSSGVPSETKANGPRPTLPPRPPLAVAVVLRRRQVFLPAPSPRLNRNPRRAGTPLPADPRQWC